jgi:hypothetical protein
MNPSPEKPDLLDGLLHESFGRQRPRILSVDTLKRTTYSSARLAELDDALRAARKEPHHLYSSTQAVAVVGNWSSTSWYVLATMAAGIAIAVFGWSVMDQFKTPAVRDVADATPSTTEKSKIAILPAGSDSTAAENALDATESKPKVASAEAMPSSSADGKSSDKLRPERVSLSLDNLPFGKSSAAEQDSTNSKNKVKVEPLSEQEVVALIDRATGAWWKQYQVQAAPSIGGEEWITRASLRLVSREPSAAELERFAKKDSGSARTEWIHQATGSMEFQRFWGKRLAAYYVGDSLPMFNNEMPEDRKEFVKWCQNEFKRSGMRADQVTAKLLKLTADAGANDSFSPSSYWWSEIGRRGNLHVADFISTEFMERRGTCERCHDKSIVSGSDQAGYWGLAAVTRGVKVEQSTNDAAKWLVSFRPKVEPLFYERSDSTMVAADPVLPNGKRLTVGSNDDASIPAERNVAELTEWLVTSEEFAKSQVNFAWQTLFGSPLVGSFPLDEKDAKSERQALLTTLSRQLIANEFDMRRLATWLTSSQAFARKSISLDGQWYISAGEDELESAHRRQVLFASFPITSDPSFRSLNRLVAWTEQVFPATSATGGVLAQPILPANPRKAIAGMKSENRDRLSRISPSQVRYLVESYSLPEVVQKEVDRWLQSKLTWPQLVEHAFLMTGTRLPNLNELEAAQRLLDLTRDRKQTLYRIIASRM